MIVSSVIVSVFLAGWQRYTEAVWLYTDAMQQAPRSDAAASLHENRAAALLVLTLSSSSVCCQAARHGLCPGSLAQLQIYGSSGPLMARLLHQARDWAGDAWASLTDSEAAGAVPSGCSGSVEGTVQGPARAALLRVQALFVLGLTEVQHVLLLVVNSPAITCCTALSALGMHAHVCAAADILMLSKA